MAASNPILKHPNREISASPTSILEVDDVEISIDTKKNAAPLVVALQNHAAEEGHSYEAKMVNAFALGEFSEPTSSHAMHYGLDTDTKTSGGLDEGVCLDHNQLQSLVDVASRFARTGQEEKALKTYKSALQLTQNEVVRIQRQLQTSKDKPKYLKATINIVLNEERTKVAMAIADIRTMMAILYERVGDYENAIYSCNEAKDVYERQSQYDEHDNTGLSEAKDNAIKMKQMAEKMQEASNTFSDRKLLHAIAVEIHRKIMLTENETLRAALYEALLKKLKAAFTLECSSLGDNHPQISETLAFLSKIHMEKSNHEQALVAMEQSLASAEISLGEIHPRTANKYLDIARLCGQTTNKTPPDTERAIEYYKKAVEAFQQAEEDNSRKIGSTLNDMGALQLKVGKLDLAVENFSDAIGAYEECASDERATVGETCQIWWNLADCHTQRKKLPNAISALSNALFLQRDARRLFDTAQLNNTPEPKLHPLCGMEHIGDTLTRLGKCYASQKRFEKAYASLLEALTLLQMIYDEEVSGSGVQPDNHDLYRKQDNVAKVTYCIAEVKHHEEKLEEAEQMYQEALTLRVDSDKGRPANAKKNNAHCATCLAGIGSIRMEKKQFKLAFKAFNQAIQFTRQDNLPEYHAIVQALWEKSREAARHMAQAKKLKKETSKNRKYKPSPFSDQVANCTSIEVLAEEHLLERIKEPPATDHVDRCVETTEILQEEPVEIDQTTFNQTTALLEQKAHSQKASGDLGGAIQTTEIELESRRIALKQGGKKAKYEVIVEKQGIIQALVRLAQLVQIKDDIKYAERLYKEVVGLMKATGCKKDTDCVQDARRELERLRWRVKSERKRGGK